jgi:hypothetical protein
LDSLSGSNTFASNQSNNNKLWGCIDYTTPTANNYVVASNTASGNGNGASSPAGLF